MINISDETKERFWEKVEKGSNCWTWLGAKAAYGYGSFSLNSQMVGAHRISWMLANNQEIPKGMDICHKCDNPSCVNPKHLFLGTHAKNIKDSYDKGRSTQVGEYNSCHKLSEKDVIEIRKEWNSEKFNYGDRKLFLKNKARRYGVVKGTIASIVYKQSWKHIEGA